MNNINLESFTSIDLELTHSSPIVEQTVDIIENLINVPFKKNLRPMIATILMNLYETNREGYHCITFNRNKNHYKAKSRYNNEGYSENFIVLIDAMSEAGCFGLVKGFYNRDNSKASRKSRILITEETRDLLRGFNPYMPVRPLTTETVIFKNSDKELEEYEDTEDTNQNRANILQYNAFIQEALDDRTLLVRRVYNNSDWGQGGRYYFKNGRYQTLKKALRAELRIQGEAVVEPDFSAIHVVLLYAQEGIDLFKDGYEDPYDMDVIAEGMDDGESTRDILKLLLLYMFNSKNAVSTLHTQRRKKGLSFISNAPELVQAFKDKHTPIAHHFNTCIANQLMNLDSKIMERILMTCTARHIPVIPVHDSIICKTTDGKEVIQIMIDSAYNILPISWAIDKTILTHTGTQSITG